MNETTTRVVRIEHATYEREVMDKRYPAGPYAETTFCQAEHGMSYLWMGDEDIECEGDCLHEWASRLSWDCSERRPVPYGHVEQHQFFAFRSVEAMREWFLGEFAALKRYGFVASVYEVPEQAVRHEAQQTLFEFDKATKIASAKPDAFSKLEKWLSNA